MGILAKIFGGVPWEELDGISLNTKKPFWSLEGETDFPRLFAGLPLLLPENSILYFEDSSPSDELEAFLRQHSVPEQVHVAMGTLWPRPKVFHIPASPENLRHLEQLMQSRASPELAIHFHVYCEGKVILEWHDAFFQPLLVSGTFGAAAIQQFCGLTGLKASLLESDSKET